MSNKTKERMVKAMELAKETYGEGLVNQNPNIVSAILTSMALDDLSARIQVENEKLTECLFRSAGHIAE